VTWPLFLVSTFENVVICAGYGADHVLRASWLTYSRGSGGAVLLAPLCGAAQDPDAETLAALRQLEDHGVQVGVASGHRGRPWVRPSELREDESRRRD
jgi:hypothetical protein